MVSYDFFDICVFCGLLVMTPVVFISSPEQISFYQVMGIVVHMGNWESVHFILNVGLCATGNGQ